LRKWVKN